MKVQFDDVLTSHVLLHFHPISDETVIIKHQKRIHDFAAGLSSTASCPIEPSCYRTLPQWHGQQRKTSQPALPAQHSGISVLLMSINAVANATGISHGLLYLVAFITSGTLNTVFFKMQYGVRANGTELCVDPSNPTQMTTLCAFDKPWFTSLLARIGMSLPLVFVYVRHLQLKASRRSQFGETASLLAQPDNTNSIRLPLKTAVAIAWPSLLDQLQTLIGNVGLLWVSASVYQMACGSVIVFSALVSVQFLHKPLHAYHYVSILMVCVAVGLVGWAGTAHEDGTAIVSTSPTHAVLGLSLIVMAQLLTAVQIVTEEYIMTSLHVDPLLLVGVEGLWGLIFYVILIPVLTLTPAGTTALGKIWHEDFGDSFIKISNSPALVALSLLNIASVAALGSSANYVTKHLSSVMRSIAEVLRSLGVWIAGLFVFYIIDWHGASSPGEAWTLSSWVQLVGFALMVQGTLTVRMTSLSSDTGLVEVLMLVIVLCAWQFKKVIVLPWPCLYTGDSSTTVSPTTGPDYKYA